MKKTFYNENIIRGFEAWEEMKERRIKQRNKFREKLGLKLCSISQAIKLGR